MQHKSHKCTIAENNKRKNKVKFLISHTVQVSVDFSQNVTRPREQSIEKNGMRFALLWRSRWTCSMKIIALWSVKNEPYKTFTQGADADDGEHAGPGTGSLKSLIGLPPRDSRVHVHQHHGVFLCPKSEGKPIRFQTKKSDFFSQYETLICRQEYIEGISLCCAHYYSVHSYYSALMLHQQATVAQLVALTK